MQHQVRGITSGVRRGHEEPRAGVWNSPGPFSV